MSAIIPSAVLKGPRKGPFSASSSWASVRRRCSGVYSSSALGSCYKLAPYTVPPPARTSPCGNMGIDRTLCPVASKIAFPTAGAIPMMGHSPAPATQAVTVGR